MIDYVSGSITNGLNSVPGFTGARSYLNFFYDFPGDFVDGINQVFGITEGGVSILATIFLVCIILTVLMHFTSTNHN